MSSEKIICRIYDEPNIRVAVYDKPKITIKFGDQGLKGDKGATGPTGPAGTTNHSELLNLDYAKAGHTDFQKKLTYISEYKAYLVE